MGLLLLRDDNKEVVVVEMIEYTSPYTSARFHSSVIVGDDDGVAE